MKPPQALCALTLLAALAWPASANELSWTFQQIDPAPANNDSFVSLDMRTGATWPTVFYPRSNSAPELQNQMIGATLTPAGWLRTPLGQISGPSPQVRSAAGPDGRVGATWLDLGGYSAAQLTTNGWSTSRVADLQFPPSPGQSDIAYRADSTPVVSYFDPSEQATRVALRIGGNWQTTTPLINNEPLNGEFHSVAVDSLDRVGLAYVDGPEVRFALNNPLAGGWQSSIVGVDYQVESLALAVGPNDETAVGILHDGGEGRTVTVATFDTQSGTWSVDFEVGGIDSERVDLKFSNDGKLGFTYVTDSLGPPAARLVQRDGNGWQDYALPSGFDFDSGLNVEPVQGASPALAYDHAGIPILAYYAQDGLVLAYDPPIPEPATAALLVVGGLLTLRRR